MRPKHKEVTFWVAGIDKNPFNGPDKVIVVEATFIETAKQYRLKKEDSKEFRFAARFLQRITFDKKSNTLCATKAAALTKLRDYFKRNAGNARTQLNNFIRLGILVACTMMEDGDA